MAGAECEGGMAWRGEKEVVIHKAFPDSEGLTPLANRREFGG